MKSIKNYFFNLYAIDVLVILFATFLTILNLLFINRIESWAEHVFLNTLLIIFILIISEIDKKKKTFFWTQLHYWYILPIIFFSFKEIYYMVKPIAGADCDHYLIAIDKFIFGLNPTQFLHQFSTPFITEVLQISYSTFFFLPIILIVELQLKKETLNFKFAAFTIVLGFILSYIGYFLVPAVGPRFTLHNFELTNIELPGLWLTNSLREIINTGESIPTGTINPIAVVQRDVFPSGHTQMTLIVMFFAYKFRLHFRHVFYVVGSLLIIATVYLRYHYVIDAIGGLIFMILTIYLAKYLFNWWSRLNGEKTFSYPSKTKSGI